MIGGNDVRNAALQGTGVPAVTNGVGTELTEISTLADEGGKHFLAVNVPNVGIIPEFAQDSPTLAAAARLLANCTTRTLPADYPPSSLSWPRGRRFRTSTFTGFAGYRRGARAGEATE